MMSSSSKQYLDEDKMCFRINFEPLPLTSGYENKIDENFVLTEICLKKMSRITVHCSCTLRLLWLWYGNVTVELCLSLFLVVIT